MTQDFPSSSQLLEKIKSHEGDAISIAEIVAIFREGGFALLLIVFAGPLALPLPALGIAQVLAVPILLLSAQLAVGRHSLWLPKKIARKTISTKRLNNVLDKVIPILRNIELLLKPRLRFVTSGFGQRIIGVMCFVCAISVALPFPFSNTVPSMGIVLMSLGLLERDGLAILAGVAVGFIGICIATAVMYFGVEAVMAVVDVIKEWLGLVNKT